MNEEELIIVNYTLYEPYAREGLVNFEAKYPFTVDGITYHREWDSGASRNMFDFLMDGN